MKKLLVVDGNSLLNRAYYGVRPLTTKEGLFTNAVYGMVSVLLRTLDSVAPDFCCIAFDRREPTFRHNAFADYKAGRHAMPDELRMQFPYAKETAAAMGFTVTDCAGYEADDILGTLSKQAEDAGYEAFLLTGDRDSLQLIDDRITVLLETNKGTVVFDRAHFFEEYGVQPEQFVDVKALMGDTSDNISGVPGIGEKTALRLISEHVSLDRLYDGLETDDKGLKPAVLAKLRENKENAYFSRMLSAIVRDAPLPVPFSALPERTVLEDRYALRRLFVKLEFSAFLRRLGLDTLPEQPDMRETAAPSGTEESAAPSDAEMSSADNASRADDIAARPVSPDELRALPIGEAAALAIDTDSPDNDGNGGGVTLWVRTEKEMLVCTADSISALAPFLGDRDRTFFVHDAKAWYHAVLPCGAEGFSASFDTMLAGYLLEPGENVYTPDRLALKYLNKTLSEDVGGAILAETVFRLVPILERALRETGTERLYASVELPLARVLYRMEQRGFRIDTDGVKRYGEALSVSCEEYLARIYQAAGRTFNVNSPKQLAEVLYDVMGLPCPGKKRSTNAEVLEKLRSRAPIISDILEYRQVMKLKSTYADGLLRVADADGRIHSSFNQTVTATGRLSSTEPNLQNIPVRTELGRELRRYFVPSDKEHILIDADYSQIELRLLAAISGDETMQDAFNSGVDIHALTASEVFRVPLDKVTPELRKRAKAVNFGIVYGIGEYSLSEDIGVSRREAGAYIASYLQTYPCVAAYLHDVVAQAKADGYVTTLWGRRRYIPELSSSKKMLLAFGERVAMNSPIQGTAADIIKAAMIGLDRALERSGLDAHLILQVHDELIVECAKDCADEVSELLRQEMEHTIELAVPLTVDISAGETWYDGH